MHTFKRKKDRRWRKQSPRLSHLRLAESAVHHRSQSAQQMHRQLGNQAVQTTLQGSIAPGGHENGARSLRDLVPQRSPTSTLESPDERDADRMAKRALQMPHGGSTPADSQGLAAGRPTASGNSALPDSVRQGMEVRFGFDFSKVQIRADDASARNAAALGARAYTAGRHVMFGAGQFQPQTTEGKKLLAHELAHVVQQAWTRHTNIQLARLSDWQTDRTAVVTDADIRTTTEYRAYMNPALVWQTRDHVTEEEAIQACRYILAALRNGVAFNWYSDARTYMNRARTYLQSVRTLITEQETWLTGEAAAAGRTVGEHIHSVAQAGGYGGGPAPWWDGLSDPDKVAWMTNATTVISDVVASVRGTPLEAMVAARGIVASPRECESLGAFAFFSSRDNRLHVGREWIRIADHDPLDVHDNIAHELGGHFEYRQYGTGMTESIMAGVLAGLSPAERARATAGPRGVFSAYGYPETEIFAELREYDLRTAASGGDVPATDVPRQLRAIRDRFAPNVARAIVTELRQRVQEASNISAAAKTLFDTSIRAVFPGLLPP